ncbi:MAG: phosphate ABC transporter permease [Leptolyngbyaceae bacterium]|nr:phosphate ABC transporter permease [Leptolyngbyaceae bacterium]
MLTPITRQKFEQLVPLTATAEQYRHYWGKAPDFLKRLLISVVGAAVALLLEVTLGKSFAIFSLLFGSVIGLYWLWGPVFWATRRNMDCRKYPYSGFWQGRVLDVFITEELIGKEETVNNKGDLVIVENRERRINLEVGDESGFSTKLQVPLQRGHQAIIPGQPAEMLIMSYQPDLGRIVKKSDIYIPSQNIWVSDYPYVQRSIFVEVSRQLRSRNRPSEERGASENSRRRSARGNDAKPSGGTSRRSARRQQPSDYED